MVDVGLQVLGRPPFHVRLGDEARHLAADIGHFRQGLQFVLPRVENLVLDVGLADMIQDEGDIGALPDEFDGVRQLRVEDADIEGQPVRRQQADAFNKPGLKAEISVLGLQQAADALDQGNGGQGLEIFVGHRAPFERGVGHDPADPAVLPGETGYPFRFLDVLARVAFALHEDHLLHLDLSASLPVFIQQVPLNSAGECRPASCISGDPGPRDERGCLQWGSSPWRVLFQGVSHLRARYIVRRLWMRRFGSRPGSSRRTTLYRYIRS